jgi:hypothetical protein
MTAAADQLEAAKAGCEEREHKLILSMTCLIDVFAFWRFAAEGYNFTLDPLFADWLAQRTKCSM